MVQQKHNQLFEQVFEGLSAQEVLDLIPAKIFLKDRDGVYIGANKAAKDFAKADLEGKTDFDMFWKDSADAFRKNDLIVMESKKPHTFIEEAVVNNRTGKYSNVKGPLFNKNGDLVGVIGIPNDI